MSKNELTITNRFRELVRQLCHGLHERNDEMTVALLAVLAGQNVFLLGPPGTAKSLMARRLSCAFTGAKHFEYLMQKFSTPEEIFGPIDISELKKGNYVRKTAGYLPTADFAFLDEIWKSNPPILNTLLTITNEKIFRNGDYVVKNLPLKGLIGASNETPPKGEGLEALWDRFVVRLYIPPLSSASSFENFLTGESVTSEVEVDPKLAISTEEWQAWQTDIGKVKLSSETLQAICLMRAELNLLHEKSPEGMEYYVSDRRWQRGVTVLKAVAFFSGRKDTNIFDVFLLRHTLWSNSDSRKVINAIVTKSLGSSCMPELSLDSIHTLLNDIENGSIDKENISNLKKAKNILLQVENSINDKLFHSNRDMANDIINNDFRIISGLLNDFRSTRFQVQRALELPAPIKCDILDVEFCFVPGGDYEMGNNCLGGKTDEYPKHNVYIDKFYIGKNLITQKDWLKIMSGNPANFKDNNNPIEGISWDEVQEFIRKLNTSSKKLSYRLPTEAEWEYAARYGENQDKYSGSNEPNQVAWHIGISGKKTNPVALKKANGIGLYDMSGNVWEWCNDYYAEDYYCNSPKINPQGPGRNEKNLKVLRGGSWISIAEDCSVSSRHKDNGSKRDYSYGFRLICCVR